MSSLAKIEANRRNGAKSKGPITPEGKARSAMNARKHGFTSEKIVLTTEDQPKFDRMLQEFTTHYNPLSVVEEQYVLEMTWNRWRLHRLWNAETVYIEDQLTRPVNNQGKRPHVATGLLIADLTRTGEALDTIPRYELRLNRLFNKSKQNLLEAQEIRRNRVILDDDHPEPIPGALTLVPISEKKENEPTTPPAEPPIGTNEPNPPAAEPQPASDQPKSEENEPTASVVQPASKPEPARPTPVKQYPDEPDISDVPDFILEAFGLTKKPNEPKSAGPKPRT